jgi:hypothetical protein
MGDHDFGRDRASAGGPLFHRVRNCDEPVHARLDEFQETAADESVDRLLSQTEPYQV